MPRAKVYYDIDMNEMDVIVACILTRYTIQAKTYPHKPALMVILTKTYTRRTLCQSGNHKNYCNTRHIAKPL